MKTLDEVIDALDEWMPDCPAKDDALHYLKEYRSDMLMYAANQKHWEDELKQKIKDFGDAKDRYIAKLKELDIGTLNNPLTWDELKTMEGKPVWVEESAENGLWWTYWVIWEGDNAVLPKKDYSTKWQAYRKERK